jgi:hypothetical protein
MNPLIRENRYSGLRHHAKVHSFRIFTVILAWVFIAAAFYEKPVLLTGLQITLIVVFLRVVLSGIASLWRLVRGRDPSF